jgi:SAM-dependent methyltransferase
MTPLQREEIAAKMMFHIDAMWCDVRGVYVRGWAHCQDEPVVALHLRCGDAVAVLDERQRRPDVRSVFPAVHSEDCGFMGYLACQPFQPVLLGISTREGTAEFPLPGDAQAHVADTEPEDDSFDRFVDAMKQVRGNVVEIGARAVSPGASLQAERFAPECAFQGIDIHAAPGVDVVADAHYLSSVIAPNSVDGVFSMAVLEHLAAPWVVAAEINRVLKIGGLTYHLVPHSWPVHEMPNDFWRMSHEGLKVIFGAATGFDVVVAAMTTPLQMIPPPSMRRPPFLEFPLMPGMAGSYILARKIAHLETGAVRWPLAREDVEKHSRTYPLRAGDAA